MFLRSGPSLSIFQNEKVNKRLFYFFFFSVTRVFYFLCFCVPANHTRWLVITRSSNVLHTGKIQESTCLSLLLFLFFFCYLCHKTGKVPQSAWVGLFRLQMWFTLCRFKIHLICLQKSVQGTSFYSEYLFVASNELAISYLHIQRARSSINIYVKCPIFFTSMSYCVVKISLSLKQWKCIYGIYCF